MARETVAVETLARLAISRMSIAGLSPGFSKRLPALYSNCLVCGLTKLTRPPTPGNRLYRAPNPSLCRHGCSRRISSLNAGRDTDPPDQNRENCRPNYPKLE